MSVRSTIRRPVPGTRARRSRRVRRASAGLSPVRAGAALAMLVSAAAIYGAAASSAFDYTRMQVHGLHFTQQAEVDAALAGARGSNLFELSTVPLVAVLRGLDTVADASVDAGLPNTLAVTLVERDPVVAWRVADRRYLVDRDGLLFGALDGPAPDGAPDLPVVTDDRGASRGLGVGSRLDPIDLDAATRLGSLTPAQVGSAADAVSVVVNDEHGFTLQARPQGWLAIFGFYTPTLRRTDLIPGQVRLLATLLAGREATVARVILADADDGTYLPRPSAKPPTSTKPAINAKPPASAKPPAGAKPPTSAEASGRP